MASQSPLWMMTRNDKENRIPSTPQFMQIMTPKERRVFGTDLTSTPVVSGGNPKQQQHHQQQQQQQQHDASQGQKKDNLHSNVDSNSKTKARIKTSTKKQPQKHVMTPITSTTQKMSSRERHGSKTVSAKKITPRTVLSQTGVPVQEKLQRSAPSKLQNNSSSSRRIHTTPSADENSRPVQYSVTFNSGPVGMKLEPVLTTTQGIEVGCRVKCFVGDHSQARLSRQILPGDLLIAVQRTNVVSWAYPDVIRLLKLTTGTKTLTFQSLANNEDNIAFLQPLLEDVSSPVHRNGSSNSKKQTSTTKLEQQQQQEEDQDAFLSNHVLDDLSPIKKTPPAVHFSNNTFTPSKVKEMIFPTSATNTSSSQLDVSWDSTSTYTTAAEAAAGTPVAEAEAEAALSQNPFALRSLGAKLGQAWQQQQQEHPDSAAMQLKMQLLTELSHAKLSIEAKGEEKKRLEHIIRDLSSSLDLQRHEIVGLQNALSERTDLVEEERTRHETKVQQLQEQIILMKQKIETLEQELGNDRDTRSQLQEQLQQVTQGKIKVETAFSRQVEQLQRDKVTLQQERDDHEQSHRETRMQLQQELKQVTEDKANVESVLTQQMEQIQRENQNLRRLLDHRDHTNRETRSQLEEQLEQVTHDKAKVERTFSRQIDQLQHENQTLQQQMKNRDEEYEEQKKQWEHQLEQVTQGKGNVETALSKQVEQLQREKQKLKQRLQDHEESSQTIQTRLQNQLEQLTAGKVNVETVLSRQVQELEVEKQKLIKQYEHEVRTATDQYQASLISIQDSNNNIRDLQAKLQDAQSALQERTKALAAVTNECKVKESIIVSIKNRSEQLESEVEHNTESIEKLTKIKNDLKHSLASSLKKLDSLMQNQSAMEQAVAREKTQRQQVESDYAKVQQKLEARTIQVKHLESESRSMKQQFMTLEDELNRVLVERRRIRADLDSKTMDINRLELALQQEKQERQAQEPPASTEIMPTQEVMDLQESLKQANTTVTTLETELASKTQDLRAITDRCSELGKEMKSINMERSLIQEKLEKERELHSSTLERRTELESTMNLLKSELSILQQEKQGLLDVVELLEDECAMKDKEIQQLSINLQHVQDRETFLADKLKELDSKGDILTEQMMVWEKERIHTMNEVSVVKHKNATLEATLAKNKLALHEKDSQIKTLLQKQESLTSKADQLDSVLKKQYSLERNVETEREKRVLVEADCQLLQDKLDVQTSRMTQLEIQKASADHELAQVEDELIALKVKIETMEQQYITEQNQLTSSSPPELVELACSSADSQAEESVVEHQLTRLKSELKVVVSELQHACYELTSKNDEMVRFEVASTKEGRQGDLCEETSDGTSQELSNLRASFNHLNSTLSTLQHELMNKTENLDWAVERCAELESLVAAMKREKNRIETELLSLRAELRLKNNMVEELNQQREETFVNQGTSIQAQHDQELSNLRESYENLDIRATNLQADLAIKTEALNAAERHCSDLKSQNEKLKTDDLQLKYLKNELERVTKENMELVHSKKELKHSLTPSFEKLNMLMKNYASMQQEVTKEKKHRECIESDYLAFQQKFDAQAKQLTELESKRHSLQERVAALEQELGDAVTEQQRTHEDLALKVKEIDRLESLLERERCSIQEQAIINQAFEEEREHWQHVESEYQLMEEKYAAQEECLKSLKSEKLLLEEQLGEIEQKCDNAISELHDTRTQLSSKIEEVERLRYALEQEIKDHQDEVEAERHSMNDQLAALKQELSDAATEKQHTQEELASKMHAIDRLELLLEQERSDAQNQLVLNKALQEEREQWQHAESKYQLMQEKCTAHEERLLSLESEKTFLEEQLCQINKECNGVISELHETRTELTAKMEEVDRLKFELEHEMQQRVNLQDEVAAERIVMKDQLTALEQELSDAVTEQRKTHAELASKIDETHQLELLLEQERLSNEEQAVVNQAFQKGCEQWERVESKYQSMEEKCAAQKEHLKSLESEKTFLEEQLCQINKECNGVISELHETRTELTAKMEEVDRLKFELEREMKQCVNLQDEVAAERIVMKDQLTALEQELSDAVTEQRKTHAELASKIDETHQLELLLEQERLSNEEQAVVNQAFQKGCEQWERVESKYQSMEEKCAAQKEHLKSLESEKTFLEEQLCQINKECNGVISELHETRAELTSKIEEVDRLKFALEREMKKHMDLQDEQFDVFESVDSFDNIQDSSILRQSFDQVNATVTKLQSELATKMVDLNATVEKCVVALQDDIACVNRIRAISMETNGHHETLAQDITSKRDQIQRLNASVAATLINTVLYHRNQMVVGNAFRHWRTVRVVTHHHQEMNHQLQTTQQTLALLKDHLKGHRRLGVGQQK